MIQIKWLARGGQGGFTASRLLGLAAVKHRGGYAQAFPSFGPERRGALVYSYTRVDDRPIQDHSQLSCCDYAIILDETLLDTTQVTGLSSGSIVFLNTAGGTTQRTFGEGVRVVPFDATAQSMQVLGRDISNTAMAAVCAAVTGLADADSLEAAARECMPAKLVEKNAALMRRICELVAAGSSGGEDRQVHAAARVRAPQDAVSDKPGLTARFQFPGAVEELPLGPSCQTGVFLEGNAGWRSRIPVVDHTACVKCMTCWVMCPEGVIDREMHIDMNFCKGCGICARECPKKAIAMWEEEK